MSVGARDDNGSVVVVVVEVSEQRAAEGLASQERLRAACKNAVTLAGSGKRSLSERARSSRRINWAGLDGLGR